MADPIEQAKVQGDMERLSARLDKFMAQVAPGNAYVLVYFGEEKNLQMITSLDQEESVKVVRALLKLIGGDA